jgi:beta-glucanase (GH16 family)
MYRVDWMPGKTTWYVNGEPVAEISFQAPRDPAGLILNMWSNGGSWTGNMSVYDEAYLQVQWVEVVYNTSDPAVERDEGLENRRETSGCEVACSVDESVNVTGSPVVLWNSTGIGPMPLNARGMASMGWISILVVGAVALRWI